MDIQVQTKGWTGTNERFLVTNLGTEDLILGYPWLTLFEPKFSWNKATIDVTFLSIIIQSLNWERICNQLMSMTSDSILESQISRIMATPLSDHEKDQIVEELQQDCEVTASIASQLAQEAQQYTKKVEIMEEYQWHWRAFSKEEAH